MKQSFYYLATPLCADPHARSAFIRTAIQKAIAGEQERTTAAAYRRVPDSADDAWFDQRVWEAKPAAYRKRRKR